MSKESFKSFVRLHPELSHHVMNKKATWQQFYELYDLYGENNSVWNDYFNNTVTTTRNSGNSREFAMGELVKMIKNVDLNSVQKTVGNLQKTIGLLQDLGIGSGAAAISEKPYEPRPMYRYFED